MPKPSPEEIINGLKRGDLAKSDAIALLISYIKNSEKKEERVKSIELLNQLEMEDEGLFDTFEELAVSDSDYEISALSAEIIIKSYFERGLKSIKWILEHFSSPYQLAKVLRSLLRYKPDFLRTFLLEELDNIVLGYIKQFHHLHKSFINGLIADYKEIFKNREISEFSTEHLMDILINFQTVVFIDVYYEIWGTLVVYFKDGYVVEFEMEFPPEDIKKIGDFEGIFNFERLERISLTYTSLEDLEGIEKFTKLIHLGIRQSELKEMKHVNKLKNLEILALMGSKLTEIAGSEGLQKLNELHLESNAIREIKNLDSLKNLEFLALNFNKIQEIKGLENLTNIRTIYLAGNKITKISGLETLTNLEDLDLAENRVKKIEGLEGLTKLERLDLDMNEIEILENIAQLEALESLTLSNNRISQIKGLEKRINHIVIFLEGNPLSENVIKYVQEFTNKKKKIVIKF